MSSYSRADVRLRSEHGELFPVVNVKVYGDVRDSFEAFTRAEDPDVRFTLEWIAEHVSDDELGEVFWHACQSEYEYLERWTTGADGDPMFPDHAVTLEQCGRSGGWIIVRGLPDLEDWDAVLLARWRRFERIARDIAADVPFQMLEILYLNDFERWSDEQEDASVSNAEAPVDIAGRLEYLRGEIRAERISYGEILELQGLARYVDRSDVELLEWAGVPEGKFS